MTPNNSDQAAMHDELRLRIQKAIADGCNMRWQDAEKAARAAIAALTLPASEAVAWQCRYRSQASRPWSEWEDSDKEIFDSLQAKPQVTWEARELFTATSSAELLRLAEKWRRLASYEDEEGEPEQEAGSVARLRQCADELTALLSGGAAREGK